MKRITELKLPKEIARQIGSLKSKYAAASSEPIRVYSFEQLVKLTAQISVLNSAIVPYFRGQKRDYCREREGGRTTTLLPSIYRPNKDGEISAEIIEQRFAALDRACELLAHYARDLPKGSIPQDVFKRKICRWALLQHYEVCPTPLIDITQSLRMACMFAFDNAGQDDSPVVYMVGMPYTSGPITFDANKELYLMRLLSLMPPIAERPFYQEGYLVGSEFPRRGLAAVSESDLACRVMAKFELFGEVERWKAELGHTDRKMIYPEDEFSRIAKSIRGRLIAEKYVLPEYEELSGVVAALENLAALFPNIRFVNAGDDE